MAPLKLPELKIEKETATSDIKTLRQLVKPEWPQESIQIKKMSGGYSCTSYHCYLKEEPQGGFTVRVKKLFLEYKFPLIDSSFEDKAVELVSEHGLFPKLLAIFHNGYCYEYAPGEVIVNYSEIKDNANLLLFEEATIKQIAKKLASIHSLKMLGENYSKSDFFSKVSDALRDHYPEDPDMPNKNSVQEELDELIKYANQLPLKVVLCHGDAYPANMIWNKNTKEVTIIDWEFANIGYQAYDIVFFLYSICFLDKALGPEKSIPKETVEKFHTQFLRFYVDEWNQHCETDYTTLCNHVGFGELLFYIVFVICEGSLLIPVAEAEPPMSSKQLINDNFKKYLEKKNGVLQQLGLKTAL